MYVLRKLKEKNVDTHNVLMEKVVKINKQNFVMATYNKTLVNFMKSISNITNEHIEKSWKPINYNIKI